MAEREHCYAECLGAFKKRVKIENSKDVSIFSLKVVDAEN
jgi:hypothetical protein